MRLSDILRQLDLSAYPQAALVLFLAVFVAVAWRALRTPGSEMERCSHIPLEQGDSPEERNV